MLILTKVKILLDTKSSESSKDTANKYYSQNIYEKTPKFHERGQSFETTESEDTDVDGLKNYVS